jgi:putative transcriptional regulator
MLRRVTRVEFHLVVNKVYGLVGKIYLVHSKKSVSSLSFFIKGKTHLLSNLYIEVSLLSYKCRLKAILADLEIRHGEFADILGIDKSTISAIINNKSLPSFDTLYAIVEELTKIDPSIKLSDIWKKI